VGAGAGAGSGINSSIFIISPPLPVRAMHALASGSVSRLRSDLYHGLRDGLAGAGAMLVDVTLTVLQV
jgi:hypothetical protein